MIPALLKWIGNKQRFAQTIVSYMPNTFENYYEPFLGSGAVLGELLKQNQEQFFPHFRNAFASDNLPFLIEIFNIVKSDPNALIDYYQNEISAYYRDPDNTYSLIRERFCNDHNAYDFCLLSRTCYSGIIRFRKTDGYMSTPRGPHKPITPDTFRRRVLLWSELTQLVDFSCLDFSASMARAKQGDVIYCDPPYTHSQTIIYGAQSFQIDNLWRSIDDCKKRGVYVMLSLNGMRESKRKNISVELPQGLFEREILVNCGTSMIDRLQNSGKEMNGEQVHDRLLLTW